MTRRRSSAERRDEIIAAMARPSLLATPDMTYLQWLRRATSNWPGEGTDRRHCPVGSPWLADTMGLLEQMLQCQPGCTHRISARSRRHSMMLACWTIRSRRSPLRWRARPDAETVQLHPADVPFRDVVQDTGRRLAVPGGTPVKRRTKNEPRLAACLLSRYGERQFTFRN